MSRTPEEFEPIGYFMGYEKQVDAWGETHWWSDNNDGTAKHIGLVDSKTSLTPAECYEALGRLVEKEMMYELWSGTDEPKTIHGCSICTKDRWLTSPYDSIAADPEGMTGVAFTIHEAIEAAILALLKAEGKPL